MHQVRIAFRGPGRSMRFPQGSAALAASRARPQLSRARPGASPGLGGRPAPCNPAGRIRVRGLWPGSGGGRPGIPVAGPAVRSAAPPGGSPGRRGAPAAPCPGRAEPSGFAGACGGLAGQSAHPPLTPRRDRSWAGAVRRRRRRRAKPRHGGRRWRGPCPLGRAGSAGTGGFAAGNPWPGAAGSAPGRVPVPQRGLSAELRCPAATPRRGASGRPPRHGGPAPGGGAGRAGPVPPAAAPLLTGRAGRAGAARTRELPAPGRVRLGSCGLSFS